jgi:hypothetical protein
MKFITSRQLDRFVTDLSTVADNVLVLTSRDEATFLEAYNAELAQVWSKRLESSAVALLAVKGTPWVLDTEGVWACGDGGACLLRVRVPPREGMRLSAVGSVDDGFVLAWQHDIRAPMRPPILERVNTNGALRWSVALPVGSIGHEGVVQMRADAVTKGEWLDGYYTSRPLLGADGTAYFFRKGAVVAARDLSVDERLVLTAPHDDLFSTAIAGGQQGFYLAYSQAGSAGASLVRIDI